MSISAAQLIAIVSVQGASAARSQLLGVGAAADDAGLRLGKIAAIGVGALAVGLAAAGVASVKMAADFQQGVTRLKTGAGDVTDNMTKLGQGILKVSTATGTLTNGTAGLNAAMYQIVSSGQRGAQSLDTLKAAAQGAKIEQAKVVDVTKILTTLQTNFGISTYTAAQYMDGLVAAVAHGKITLEELSTAMSPILPFAHELGIHFADVAAAMSDMTNQGIPAAQAATALRFTFQSMILPTLASRKAMQEWGLDSAKVAETMKTSLPDALQMYITAADRAGAPGTKPMIDALSQMMGGGQRAAKALFSLSQSMGQWRGDIGLVNTALESTNKDVNGWVTVQGNLNLQLDRGKAVLAALAIQAGTQLLPVVTSLVKGFADWGSHTDLSGLANTVAGLGGNLGRAFDWIGKIATKTINTQQWKDMGTDVGKLADQLGRATQNMGDFIDKFSKTSAGGALWKDLGRTISDTVDQLNKGVTEFNTLHDVIAGKTKIDFQEAQILLGKWGQTTLSVADAQLLLARNIHTVTDAQNGQTINLDEYVKSSGRFINTSLSMANALKVVGETGKGAFLTSADAARLLALGITSVNDPVHKVTIDLRLLAAMNIRPHIDTSSILHARTDAQSAYDGLLKLKQTFTPIVPTGNILTATRDSADAYAGLLKLKGPFTPNVNDASVLNARTDAQSTYGALVRLNGTSSWNSYVNTVYTTTGQAVTYLGHAAGITNNPTGHLAMIGEKGPELMYIPKGASIYPHGTGPSGGSVGGGGQQVVEVHVYLDKSTMARELSGPLMPHIVSKIRGAVGSIAT